MNAGTTNLDEGKQKHYWMQFHSLFNTWYLCQHWQVFHNSHRQYAQWEIYFWAYKMSPLLIVSVLWSWYKAAPVDCRYCERSGCCEYSNWCASYRLSNTSWSLCYAQWITLLCSSPCCCYLYSYSGWYNIWWAMQQQNNTYPQVCKV
jgi:hypothetical protein